MAALVWTFGRECNEAAHVCRAVMLELRMSGHGLQATLWGYIFEFLEPWRCELKFGVVSYTYFTDCALHRVKTRIQGEMPYV